MSELDISGTDNYGNVPGIDMQRALQKQRDDFEKAVRDSIEKAKIDSTRRAALKDSSTINKQNKKNQKNGSRK